MSEPWTRCLSASSSAMQSYSGVQSALLSWSHTANSAQAAGRRVFQAYASDASEGAISANGAPTMAGHRGYVRLGSNLRHHGEEQEYCEDYQVNDALKHGSSAGAQRDHAGEQRQCQQDLVLRPQPELERLADHD